MSFAHLHVHTKYSALDGTITHDELIAAAVADGQPAVAETNHGTMAGIFRFVRAAHAAGIKPICGLEAYLAIGGNRFEPATVKVAKDDATVLDGEKDPGTVTKTKSYEHLTLLAANATGWANLCRVHNESQRSFRTKPLMDYQLLAEHAEGLIALTGCLGGPVAGPASRGDVDEARQNLARLVSIFGQDNVYVEVMDHGIPAQTTANRCLRELAAEFGLLLVATNDAHYAAASDAATHDAWLGVQADGFHFHGDGYHLRTEEEMRALDPDSWWQDAVSASFLVAERIDSHVLPETRMRLADYPLPDGYTTARDLFHDLVTDGAKQRFGSPLPAAAQDRISWEEDILTGNYHLDDGTQPPDFSPYFLHTRKIVEFARSLPGGIVGPGRGSVAGCAASYALGLTGVDPLAHRLSFERFFEPKRVEMPDQDIDFRPSHRPKIIKFVQDEYGFDRVARIGSYGTVKSPAAIKAATKVLGISASVGDNLALLIPKPQNVPLPLTTLLDDNDPDGAGFREGITRAGADGARIAELAAAFEGGLKSYGIHACGVVINDEDLTALVPLRRERRDDPNRFPDCWITEWDAEDIQTLGMLKLDFLVIDNLDTIALAVDMINESENADWTYETLPSHDDYENPLVQRAYQLLQRGDSAAIFQMEEKAAAELLQKVRPENLGDISAVSALNRPGPMENGMHIQYADRKNGREEIDYSHWTTDPDEVAAIDSVLGTTYGIYAYQEQLMELGRVVAGFDAVMRSQLRKAVSKKKKDQMAAVGKLFVERATTEQYDADGHMISRQFARETAERLWESMKTSGSYLFNASHSAAYGVITFVTALLKANWPVEYCAAVIAVNSSSAKLDKRTAMLKDLRAHNIPVMPPDINRARRSTTVIDHHDSKSIAIGLSEVRGVGTDVADKIIAERERNGPYQGAVDLFSRVETAHSGVVTALINAGACDVGGPRAGQLAALRGGQDGPAALEFDWGVLETSIRQRHALSITLEDTHPMTVFAEDIASWRPGPDNSLPAIATTPLADVGIGLRPGERRSFTSFALLAGWSQKAYSRGRYRASVDLSTPDADFDAVMWHDELQRATRRGLPGVGELVVVHGTARLRLVETDTDDGEGESETIEQVQLTVTAIETIPVKDTATTPPPPGRIATFDDLLRRTQPSRPEPPEPPHQPGPGTPALPDIPAQAEQTAPPPTSADEDSLLVASIGKAARPTANIVAFPRSKTAEPPSRSFYFAGEPGDALSDCRVPYDHNMTAARKAASNPLYKITIPTTAKPGDVWKISPGPSEDTFVVIVDDPDSRHPSKIGADELRTLGETIGNPSTEWSPLTDSPWSRANGHRTSAARAR